MIVIGGGAAGLTASGMSAVLGARTTLVEAARLGGDCTWNGCIPSKALLHAAKVAQQMRTADRLGLTPAGPPHDLARILQHVHTIQSQVYKDADAPPHMERLGVEVVEGTAHFLDPHTIEISGPAGTFRLSARRFIVATGSRPKVPAFEGSGSLPLFTNETIFDLPRLPNRLVVLGGGPIGIEMAQAFRYLGSQVTVIHRGTGILKSDDPELTGMLLKNLQSNGIDFLFGEQVQRLNQAEVHLQSGRCIKADAVLCALGRQPNVRSLHLDAAGVAVNARGIITDRRCRSSVRHIYASGDVAGRYLFTHMAEHMSRTAVKNALLHLPANLDEKHVTWCTFTDPELAHVGCTEPELKSAGVKYSVFRLPISEVDRARTESAAEGLIKVLADGRGRILGASILAARAGEMISGYALAMRNGIRLSGMASTIHPYPTFTLGNRQAADRYVTAQLTPRIVDWIRFLFRLRGTSQGITTLHQKGSAPH